MGQSEGGGLDAVVDEEGTLLRPDEFICWFLIGQEYGSAAVSASPLQSLSRG